MTSEAALHAALGQHGVRVLYADAHLAIVDKPYGLASQRTRAGEPGLIEALWQAGLASAALHHRLDRPASGCLAVSLSDDANPGMARSFREHQAERVYRVVLMGSVQPTRWLRPLDGAEARTDVRPLGQANGLTAAEVRLHTGRTHQIRQHAAMAGHPVAGDRRYGGEVGRAWPRLALHAWRLRLPHPITGRMVEATADIPKDLGRLWKLAGGPDDAAPSVGGT